MPTQISVHGKSGQPRAPLIRILGLGFGVAVIFGGTVGVGILRLPGTIAGKLGNFWLVLAVWAAAVCLIGWFLECRRDISASPS